MAADQLFKCLASGIVFKTKNVDVIKEENIF